jgi:ankyrin repeat protein
MRTPSSHTDTWIEAKRFTPLHDLIFKRHYNKINTELDLGSDPDAVHLTDALNRTALDWATALGRLSDMRVLILHGSLLNTMDYSGRSAVLNAVDSHNIDALRIILEAGANPDPVIPESMCRSSPLTAAAFGGLVEMIELLLSHGANVDACNPEGRTALHTVASRQTVECAKPLLASGADMHLVSKSGLSPFMTAIVCNNHAVLRYFIVECSTKFLVDARLLCIIAGHADRKTILILVTRDTWKSTVSKKDVDTARLVIQYRENYDEQLGGAFDDLTASFVDV